MKVMIASKYDEFTASIDSQLITSGRKPDDILVVKTLDDLVTALKTDGFHCIVSDYTFDGADIWQLARLINSTPLAAHALPLYLVNDLCHNEIPAILAKEHAFKVVSLDKLGTTLQCDHAHNQNIGYERGRIDRLNASLLIIEDDEDIALSTFHALKANYDIDMANNGLTGYELWLSKRHDLILLDLRLPGINGEQVLDKIMAIDPHQPVIIATGYGQEDTPIDLILNGASEYLDKPFSLQTLRSQCQTVLQRSKLIRQSAAMCAYSQQKPDQRAA